MRKNRTKHEAKKPRLAKRALALCFALIFVCSCLLPAFANSEVGALADPLTMVEPQQDEQQPTEPVLLTEGSEDSAVDNTDSTGSGTNPTEEPKPAEQEPKADEPKTEETKPEGTTESKGSAEQQGNEQTKPEEQTKTEGTTESKDSTEEQPKNEGTTGETKPEETKPEGTTEEPKPEETKPEEPKQPTTNTAGDTIDQGKATYTYRFWPDKIDAFELEAINDDVKSGTSLNDAAQSRVKMVPCTVLTVMTNANLRDYQANVQQPTKPGYEFAGWYTVEGTTEDEFSFEQSLNFEKSKTIDVFAKWNELKAVESDTLSDGGMTVKAKVGPMDNVESVTLAEPSQSDAETLRKSIDEKLYDQSYMAAIFDITPKDENGMDVEPQNGESVNVEISGLGFSAGDEGSVWVYHLTKSGRVETLYATVTSDGGVTFATKHFSPFAVVKLTEGMVSFDTGDDRLATASLEDNYTMTVGDTMTLHGYVFWSLKPNHQWGSNDPTVVEVSGNDNSATVEAISAGSTGEPATAIVTHTCGRYSNFVERTTITVNKVTSSYPLYVYVKMDPEVQKKLEAAGKGHLTINRDGWFTLGKVDKVDGLCDPEKYNGGQRPDPKLQDKYSMYQKAVASLKDPGIKPYEPNKQVELGLVDWGHGNVGGEQFGLVTATGASDYFPAEVTTRMWHLDGYIESLSAVVVNYYIVDSAGNPTSIAESKTHLGTPGSPFTLADDENLESIGKYKQVRMDSDTDESKFPASGKVKNINLYYGIDIQITKDLTTHDSTKTFTFKVTGDKLGNEDKRTLVDEYGTVLKRVEGFEMKDGKTVTLKNVEAGMHVNVTEFDRYDYDVTATNYDSKPAIPNNDGEKTFNYEVELRDGELVLVDSKTEKAVPNNHITVTNKPATTNLTVTKTATKDGAVDDTTDFNFTLTLGSASKGVTWTKGAESDTVIGTSYSFQLKNNESITFSGINVHDDKVKVEEVDVNSTYYATTHSVNKGTAVNGITAAISDTTLKENQTLGTTVDFVNKYTTPKLKSMTIQKKVTGAFGERMKDFTFKVELSHENPALLEGVTHTDGVNLTSFKLKHGGSVTLGEIPIGTTITITETGAKDYDTKATNYEVDSNKKFIYEVVADENGNAVLKSTDNQTVANSAITVENDFDGTPDTGVLLDTLPYLILLAVAVAGGVLVVVRKRKHRDE